MSEYRCPECGELGHGCYEAGVESERARADRWKKVADESDRKYDALRHRVLDLTRDLEETL